MQEFKETLQKAEGTESKLRKWMLVLGFLTKKMNEQKLKPPIIVGGSAVMFYTLEHYITYDVDLVCEDREKLENLLGKLRFKKVGRHWILPEADLAIEIPSTTLEKSAYNKLRKIKLNASQVFIIGLEDLILDRLNAYKYWKSEADRDQALMVTTGNYQDIDWIYLTKKAKKEELEPALLEVKKKAEDALRKIKNPKA